MLSVFGIMYSYSLGRSSKKAPGPQKPKYARTNRQIVDYVQKKGLDKGFNLIYVATIFLGGIIN